MRVPAWKPLLAAGALALGQAVVAVGPAVATTGPITITADMPAAVPTGHNWSFNDFFPRGLRVAQGATIQFAIEGFHTATLLPAGMSARQDMMANGALRADADDTARNPGGQTHTQLNIPGLLPAPMGCGYAPAPACTFDGSSVVSASPLGPQAPFAVTITAAPGTYVFHCRVHPGMTGQLAVLPSGSRGTQSDEVSAKVQAQVQADVHGGYAAEEAFEHAGVTTNPDGTRTWWLHAGASGAGGRTTVLEFLPRHITIKPGDKVVWKATQPDEPHTVTFPTDLFTDQVAMCETAAGDVPATPLHLPPQSPADFTCNPGPPSEIEFAPGNGVHHITSPTTISDSGLLASNREVGAFGMSSSAGLPSWSVSFAGAATGSYTYICQIHGAAMGGSISVS
ncbi:MAG TPA: hypothetical protein VF763_02470 [Candidatus Limnocylindrales bacterium]